MNRIFHGDALEELKKIEHNSIDVLVTDPPYGLEFMGKDWDKTLPDKRIWEECFRVLKPGSFGFVMCASRSNLMARLIIDLEDAGFITDFTPVYWTYNTGFPKATDISKIVDKREGIKPLKIEKASGVGFMNEDDNGYNTTKNKVTMPKPTTPEAQSLDGAYAGFQPKPAVEPVVVIMKPLSEPTYTDQALTNRKGITWLDNGRIPTGDDLNPSKRGSDIFEDHLELENDEYTPNKQGRFAPNLLVENDQLNNNKKTKSHVNNIKDYDRYKSEYTFLGGGRNPENSYDDSGSQSRYYDLDAWFLNYVMSKDLPKKVEMTYPFLSVPKPSKSEKDAGLENESVKPSPADTEFRPTATSNPENWKNTPAEVPHGGTNRGGTHKNNHPTVKPIKLMSWLIEIGSEKGDVVLDPFMGSGSTACACVLTEREYVGCEMEEEYISIALKRINHHENEMKFEDPASDLF